MYSGKEFIGTPTGLNVLKLDAPEVMRGMAVSPIPRAMARMTPVARPARRSAAPPCDRLPVSGPEGAAASRKPLGTTRSATSPARAMIGVMVTAMATETASPDLDSPSRR